MKNKNENRRWKIEDGKAVFAALLLLSSILYPPSSSAQTPVFYSGQLTPGVPQTNPVVLTAWPPNSGNAWVAIGTNLYYVGTPTTNTPNTLGLWSNTIVPTTYKVAIPALGSGAYFYAAVPNTTNYQSLALYATDIVVAANVASSAQLVATLLGFTPVANTYSAITASLGFNPATNTFNAATNLLGYQPATNTTLGIVGALGWTPPTNTFSALTNVLGYVPATNPPILLTTNWQVLVPGQLTNTLTFTNGYLQ